MDPWIVFYETSGFGEPEAAFATFPNRSEAEAFIEKLEKDPKTCKERLFLEIERGEDISAWHKRGVL